MPGSYDWALLGGQDGEAVEGLIATLLRLEYQDARQVNPSQGDGGIDVVRETPEGQIVWQVKKFTSRIDASQWQQIKHSWERFWAVHVDPSDTESNPSTVLEYHLVTPWTPTEERYADFRALTARATFPVNWEGGAYIAGLADRHPDTMSRFTLGVQGAFNQFVGERAMLAASSFDVAATMPMLDAINIRQGALDDLRASLNDNYRIEVSTRTIRGDFPPLPDRMDPAIVHRMTYLGSEVWRTESVVPRNDDATTVEPIELDTEFLEEEGSDGHRAIRDWQEWGIPFGEVRARVTTRGGPFGDLSHESMVSFILDRPDDAPALFFVVRDSEGASRMRLPLRVTERTQGSRTGWLRLVADTPQRVFHFELRIEGSAGDPSFSGSLGKVEGLDPIQVRTEIDLFLTMVESDEFSVEMQNGATVLRGGKTSLQSALDEHYGRVARGLSELQASTTDLLLMPDVGEITEGQFRRFNQLVSIYGGTALEWTWSQIGLTAPDLPQEMEAFREHLRMMLDGTHMPVAIEQPEIRLANSTYWIERPIVTTRSTCQLDPPLDLDAIEPGQTVVFVPRGDDSVTTAAVVDWTPGSYSPEPFE